MKLETGSAADVVYIYDVSVQRPILVYDGECAFCRYWVNRWRQRTEDEVFFVPFQQVPYVYFGINRAQFQKSVYLITHYRKLHGAEAVFELIAIGGNNTWIQIYRNFPFADRAFELGYQVIASNRDFFYKLLRLFVNDA